MKLRESNQEFISQLRDKLSYVQSWKQKHSSYPLFNKAEKLALCNVLSEHFEEYIRAYETENSRAVVESFRREIAIEVISRDILR